MYINIFLALAFVVSIYMLRRRISEKIPDLELIPDQDISVLLEENTAKLQRFFLHLSHFRSFYRERHYHERLRSLVTKALLKMHTALLHVDTGIMRLMKRMRAGSELSIERRHEASEYFSQPHTSDAPAEEKINRVQEVIGTRRRTSIAGSQRLKKNETNVVRLASDKIVS